jgi:hypothetical protein
MTQSNSYVSGYANLERGDLTVLLKACTRG